jgi:hypothetical protein
MNLLGLAKIMLVGEKILQKQFGQQEASNLGPAAD